MQTQLPVQDKYAYRQQKATRRVTLADKREIRRSFREGFTRKEIALMMDFSYHQVQQVLEKKRIKKHKPKPQREERYEVAQIKEVDDYESLKAKYRKAIALLIESDLLDVELE